MQNLEGPDDFGISEPVSLENLGLFPLERSEDSGSDALRQGAPLRILIVSHLYPHPGAPGRGSFVHEQARALRASRIDARVVSGFPFDFKRAGLRGFLRRLTEFAAAVRATRWKEDGGVPVLRFPYPALVPYEHRAWVYRFGLFLQRRRLEAFDFDRIHAHTAWLDGTAGRVLARKRGKPFILTEHTGPFETLVARPAMRRAVRRALKSADAVVAVSRALANAMARALGDLGRPVTVIPNGVDGATFPLTQGRREGPPQIAFVGYFSPVKNLPVLLEAFARVRSRREASLLLVGGGPESARLEASAKALGIASSVAFRGFAPREEIARILREEASVLVLPSAQETFGCVLVEALATGVPVVATRCGGPEEIVSDRTLGELCEPSDVHSLEAALERVLERLGTFDAAELRRRALDRFAFPTIARRLETLYRGLDAEGSP